MLTSVPSTIHLGSPPPPSSPVNVDVVQVVVHDVIVVVLKLPLVIKYVVHVVVVLYDVDWLVVLEVCQVVVVVLLVN